MDWMQIFTLVTGVIYIVLEIRQKSLMWAVGVLTSVAAMWVFFRQGLYASFALNTYYLVTAFIGMWQWGRDRKRLESSVFRNDAGCLAKTSGAVVAEENGGTDVIHLNRLSPIVAVVSAVVVAVGTWALAELMVFLENPMSYLDAFVAVLSAVATWWLVRSYLQQWGLWIAADLMSTALCVSQGMWWMAALYAAYTVSAVYGLVYWKKHGRYVI